MRKFIKWSLLTVIAIFILCWLFIYFVASGINETTIYTEKDFIDYYYLTDKDIKKAPRISSDYNFESRPGDGYAPSNSIIFKGVSDVEPLRAYLGTLGYVRQRGGADGGEIWARPGCINGELFYLRFDEGEGDVELTKEFGY